MKRKYKWTIILAVALVLQFIIRLNFPNHVPMNQCTVRTCQVCPNSESICILVVKVINHCRWFGTNNCICIHPFIHSFICLFIHLFSHSFHSYHRISIKRQGLDYVLESERRYLIERELIREGSLILIRGKHFIQMVLCIPYALLPLKNQCYQLRKFIHISQP